MDVAVAGPGGCADCGVGAGHPHSDVCVRVARADYEDAMGKKPYHGWTADQLRQKIAEAQAPKAAEPAASTSSDSAATVMLMCDHLFLPEDPTVAEWSGARTRKYEGKTDGKRTRVVCHPSLATFLQDRGQGEIL